MKKKVGVSPVGLIGIYVLLSVFAVLAVFPLFWMLLSSVKGASELAAHPLDFIPREFTFDHYKTVINELGFLRNMGNSVMIASASTLITLIVSMTGAYGIVRFFPRVGKYLTRMLITTYMFPPILLAVPYTVTMVSLGLINSYVGLVIAYLSFSIPYAIWMLIGFFQTVPLEIEEAAAIDGLGAFGIFTKIACPLILPGIVATAVYTFINTFNEFLYALLFINTTEKMPVAVALYSLTGSEVLDWGAMMAASVLVIAPSVLFFMAIQKHIAAGLSEGSIK